VNSSNKAKHHIGKNDHIGIEPRTYWGLRW
jgi:hypothetical protein